MAFAKMEDKTIPQVGTVKQKLFTNEMESNEM